MGLGPAIVGQAVVFGLAHSVADVIGLQVPLMLALGVGGLLAGVIAVRTRSLLIPIAVTSGSISRSTSRSRAGPERLRRGLGWRHASGRDGRTFDGSTGACPHGRRRSVDVARSPGP